MFSSSGLFRQISCPADHPCQLPNCLFSHTHVGRPDPEPESVATVQHASKRRKIADDDIDGLEQFPKALDPEKQSIGSSLSRRPDGDHATVMRKSILQGKPAQPTASDRPVSPPPLRRKRIVKGRQVPAAKEKPAAQFQESLNPRKIPHDPAGHSTRYLYLKHLHEAMQKLNNQLHTSSDADSQSIALSPGSLVTMALDEEEKIAKQNPKVYANVLKLRLVAYKKMTLDQWKSKRLEDRLRDHTIANNPVEAEQAIETGLTNSQERQVLQYLTCNIDELKKYGHITFPPDETAMAAARAGEVSGQGFEQCERCATRFQVFPNRREDGSLTSCDNCTYHPGRRQPSPKSSFHHARGEKLWSCCNDVVGASAGCATATTHVFKVSNPARLASIMQFVRTPDNPNLDNDRAVAFDCEMGYTVLGLELIRLTALSWPQGEKLLDVLVKPLGAVLDFNSQFSGVTSQHFANAVPYSPSKRSPPGPAVLQLVDSPATARRLLFALLSPSTPLIGHSLENDLNATRIVHPCVVDTAILWPHRAGPPYRQSLKVLAERRLGRHIQMGGAAGHDPAEDAKAAGDVVRETVGRKWEKMRREGWTIVEDTLCPPTGTVGDEVSLRDGDENSSGEAMRDQDV